MKFAHEFKTALIKEGFPPHWVESAIPYGQLKKCIKKVERELRSIGLDSETLAQLIPEAAENLDAAQKAVGFEYDFEGEKQYRPKLTLFVQLEDGLAVDATLSTETRAYLERLALSQGRKSSTSSESLDDSIDDDYEDTEMQGMKLDCTSTTAAPGDPVVQRIEVPLTFDTEFFGVIQNDVSILDTLQETEQRSMVHEITALSTDMNAITKPTKFGRSDLYRWRELFELYLEASPFFSTRECDSGSRSSAVAAQQLQWFQSEVTKRGLVKSFKLSASRKALDRFIAINISLLQNLSFQEMNQKAITKILKKFDKRTRLGATKTFPRLIRSDSIMTHQMAKAVCAQMSTDLVEIVPQLDDHLCPICFTIYWRPIRMKCRHVFCIRCTVLMQRQKKKFCPLCRDEVILQADTDNIDKDLVKYLQKFFPKETREKQIAIEKAEGIDQFGSYYKHPSEYECAIM